MAYNQPKMKCNGPSRQQLTSDRDFFDLLAVGPAFYLYAIITSKNIIDFSEQAMNNSGILNTYEDEGLFLYSPNTGTEEQIQVLAPSPWQDLENLYKGDSMNYISQFLSLIEEELPNDVRHSQKDIPTAQNDESKPALSKCQVDAGVQKVKKIRKVTNSPFHNYQKHLNNALKKMILLPDYKHLDQLHQRVAHRLWSKYVQSEIKTKKILHSVFNQRYEYQTNEAELRSFGFWDIYLQFGDALFREAKAYLSKLAVQQINPQNIDDYLKTRKLIKRDGFKEYLLEFRQQLINGFLKRRIILGHNDN